MFFIVNNEVQCGSRFFSPGFYSASADSAFILVFWFVMFVWSLRKTRRNGRRWENLCINVNAVYVVIFYVFSQ